MSKYVRLYKENTKFPVVKLVQTWMIMLRRLIFHLVQTWMIMLRRLIFHLVQNLLICSNYIHKNDIDKYAKPESAPLFDYKSMWNDAADAFNKHFKPHFNKMMEKTDELVASVNKTAKKI